MSANLDKFQCMVLGHKSPMSGFSVTVSGHHIETQEYMKILSITFDKELKFGAHKSNICNAASRQINALERLSKFLNESQRIPIYQAFISANFNFSPVVWMFCGKLNGKKLEKLQERALRFVYKDMVSTYEELLEKGDFLSMTMQCICFLGIEVYECNNDLNLKYLNDLLCPKELSYQLWDNNRLHQMKFNTITFGYRSFSYYGAKVWNTLPPEIKKMQSLSAIKISLKMVQRH